MSARSSSLLRAAVGGAKHRVHKIHATETGRVQDSNAGRKHHELPEMKETLCSKSLFPMKENSLITLDIATYKNYERATAKSRIFADTVVHVHLKLAAYGVNAPRSQKIHACRATVRVRDSER